MKKRREKRGSHELKRRERGSDKIKLQSGREEGKRRGKSQGKNKPGGRKKRSKK